MPPFAPSLFAGRLTDRILSAAVWLTTPLGPDDYFGLVDPLLSARHPAGRIVAVRPEGPDAATLVIRPGRGWAGHRAGQYLPVGVELDGVRHWRTYSLTSPPGRPGTPLTITVKADPRGRVSPRLVHHIPPGTVLRLGPAQGDFVLPDPPPHRMLMVSAGSGITPLMGMLRTLIRRHPRQPGRPNVVLLHTAPTPQECLFRAELRDMAARLPWFRFRERHTRTQASRAGAAEEAPPARRLTPADIIGLCPDWRARDTWACGPPGLLAAIEEHWASAGLTTRLHTERFRLTPPCPPGSSTPADHVRFARSGIEAESDPTVPLLVTGEQAGVPMPYGCRRGVCFGCLLPLLHGRVRDLRTGEVHGEPGTPIQSCVNTAASPLALDI
ncbi:MULTISPECIES: ferredoxin reductase [Streptomyces]|uniref:Ferredoxin reductase n=2 Tax=Streptomyces rimosus subsp. rimosus TaxID=132474 RepID=L8EZZ0_STRR1|nr:MULTISPECIES: ferredoxin reductase [Streptomyces]MYT41783.1 ferredoxin reductase [Streptomyces sp. SID5471]KUJ40360.1 stearoyl-CoA 9-desaturase [Streptomyces rimosus subsp. rimosus]QDA02860.1 ferredoxin reductase [Streptomyces rimosus]QEV74131.1 ferredoxin reductase [Streptomyces rimosus]QGY68707.1 ferredoxin reductase [Streptomyces rimosus R6-500]